MSILDFNDHRSNYETAASAAGKLTGQAWPLGPEDRARAELSDSIWTLSWSGLPPEAHPLRASSTLSGCLHGLPGARAEDADRVEAALRSLLTGEAGSISIELYACEPTEDGRKALQSKFEEHIVKPEAPGDPDPAAELAESLRLGSFAVMYFHPRTPVSFCRTCAPELRTCLDRAGLREPMEAFAAAAEMSAALPFAAASPRRTL